jgi:hypothetical protein
VRGGRTKQERADRRVLGGRAWLSLPDFARMVLRVAARPEVHHFHDRAFIGSTWEHLPRELAEAADLAAFKRRLVDAHRQRLLSLSRADLVSAMDPRDVAQSETLFTPFGGVHPVQFHLIEARRA